jgi:quercetin 2,3-dioxygenase
MKHLESILPSPPMHWVGDGFPVSTIISPQSASLRLSPFILMDYAGPAKFAPADRPRGVDSHPHRGFETVTVVYQGELEHRDSAGHSGSIGPGDLQWMTAASGVLHEEKHSRRFTQAGGVMEMAQLWVNLPAKYKKSPPRYQTLLAKDIPTISLPNDAGSARIIAGDFQTTRAAALTFTPVILWDIALDKGKVNLPLPDGLNAAVYVRSGSVTLGGKTVAERQLAILSQTGAGMEIHTTDGAKLLILGGEPIDEPIAAYGPFVMNRPEEISEAIEDFRAGRMGVLED